jgi:hypothetical protein
MAHLKLNYFVKAHPHHTKFRRRRMRKLKPVRPSRRNELWYKAELLKITKLLSQSVRKHVLPVLQREAQFRGDAALPVSLRQSFDAVARDFGGIDKVAQRLSVLAVRRNMEEVDDRLAKAIKDSVSVDISPMFTTDGPIRAAMDAATKANVP